MKKEIICLLVAFFYILTTKANTNPQFPKTFSSQQNTGLSFTENKGQVHDQNYHPRPDVLYGVMAGNMAVHIKKTGLSYQLYRVDRFKDVIDERTKETRKEIDQQTIYRIDLNWINFNKNFTTTEDEALSGYNNYYLESCPNGALNVKSYKDVMLHNLYNGIDLHYYAKNGELKHDYIAAPHADYKQIQLKIEGADISVNKDGSLLLITPLGKVQEGAPVVFQNGKQLAARWKVENSTLSFEIENYDSNYELIIDPVTRLWGTYYGGSAGDIGLSCATDINSNVFLAGMTGTNSGIVIATSGSHQSTSGGYTDAFLVKFNSNGNRLWGTYYGGSGGEYGFSCIGNSSGDVYLAGNSSSNTGTLIATALSHQPGYGGGTTDAFLVKFNSNGVRQWSTYYGGANTEQAYSCNVDASGNIYMSGISSSTNAIATSGSHQVGFAGAYDAYLVKFNSSGVRLWGTYYGGTGQETWGFCATDIAGNIYLTGSTITSTNGIATVGSHQSTYGGGTYDVYLVKFNGNGVRQWGTYYGGAGDDIGYACVSDAIGSVYIAGYTTSNSGTIIATAGSHQSINGGGVNDAFLAKFDANGIRQWGTYYGDVGNDKAFSCNIDVNNNVYLAGNTDSNSGNIIATSGSHQTTNGGGVSDAFLVKFNSGGTRQWGTYYGGTAEDGAYLCAIDGSGSASYLAGYTTSNSGTAIATPGSHQPTYGGGPNDAFLAKFDVCETAPQQPLAISGSTIMCAASAASIYSTATVSGANSYSWSLPAGWSGTSNTNTISAAPGSSGIISLIAANSCGSSPQQTLNVTVNSLPSLTVSTTNNTLCVGETATLSASGASSYTFNPGGVAASITITPIINTTYTITGTNTNGCSNTVNFTQNVDACTGIPTVAEALEATLKVYPNPAKELITLDLNSDYEITIFNVAGELIYNARLQNGIHILDLNEFAKGVYLLRASSVNSNENLKFIKE